MVRRSIFILLAAMAFSAPVVSADTLLVDGLDQSTESGSENPNRGLTMDKVESTWGQPESKHSPVGDPPITRWEYSNFIVYFENQNVIHTVQKN
jgi:hypothetical protein